MIGCALESDFGTANTDDRGDDADLKRLGFQYRSLFNVQLEERLEVSAPGLADPIGIAAHPAQRLGQPFADRLFHVEHLWSKRAAHSAAAEARQSVIAWLFGEEIYDFQRVIQSLICVAQRARDLQSSG